MNPASSLIIPPRQLLIDIGYSEETVSKMTDAECDAEVHKIWEVE